MLLLSIETSCDETAISLVEVDGVFPTATYTILGNGLHSQTETHAPYGGVYPSLAKRDHVQNCVPMLHKALEEAGMLSAGATELTEAETQSVYSYLEREPELAELFTGWLASHDLPEIDAIAVTSGPGLEPALWVGVNFAKALSIALRCPVIPVNHMEGHVLASLYDAVEDDELANIAFPAVALLVSGGHTELMAMRDWTTYELLGQTRDDAVGEAFDKVARLLGLPYPGGPAIERLAAEARKFDLPAFKADMPRPMLHSGDLDFSFSGIKTAVRYAVAEHALSEAETQAMARDFSDAVRDVLLAKTSAAIEQAGATTLIVGGGVSASQFLRDEFTKHFATHYPDVTVYFPRRELSTDNAVMIALAGHAHLGEGRTGASVGRIRADGNRALRTEMS